MSVGVFVPMSGPNSDGGSESHLCCCRTPYAVGCPIQIRDVCLSGYETWFLYLQHACLTWMFCLF